jgi:hypothetical protein
VSTEQFLQRMVQALLEYVREQNDRSTKVIDFTHPDELTKQFDFTIPDEPVPLSDLVDDSERTLRHCVCSMRACGCV